MPSEPGSYRRWAYSFEVANAASWSVMLGAPLILFLKGQEISGTLLGVALSLMPLTQALQVLGARLLPRYGYRGLMVRGWTARTIMVGLMAVVALASPWLGPHATIATALGLLTAFTILRGFTSCAWMPWLSQLVPEQGRGRFLGYSSALIQGTLVLCNLAYAAWLGVNNGPTGFAVLFAWACAAGLLAAWLMNRIPDAPVEAEGGAGPVPWRELLRLRPFVRLLRFNVVAFIATAALGVLWVPVLRDLHHQDDAAIAMMPVWVALAHLVVLPILGPLVDRTGSRPMLAMAVAVLLLHTLLWAGLAGGAVPLAWWTLALIQGSAGLGFAAFHLANNRLLMATVPGQGRSHFFALHSCIVALGHGLGPVLWGMGLDLVGGWSAPLLGGTVNGTAALYLVAAGLLAVVLIASSRLEEPRAMPTAEFLRELLVRTPGRALARLAALVDSR